METLSLSDIEKAIPHRFENLLIDRLVRIQDGEIRRGTLELTITTEDRLGRSLFFTKPPQSVMLSPFLMEILALGSIISGGAVP